MRVLWIAAVVVLIDQVTKQIVLETMYRGQSIPVLGDWLKLTFTENPGMAFGITFGPAGLVTVFSIIATLLIILYLVKVRHGYTPYRVGLALILGGAFGNIIDRVFYGVLNGSGALFQGMVVDFIHVNLWRGYLPESLPLIGGNYVALFPIWNVADMAIVVGVVAILVFQKKFHEQLLAETQPAETQPAETQPAETTETAEAAPAVNGTPSEGTAWTPPATQPAGDRESASGIG